jgi:hypothetical protein
MKLNANVVIPALPNSLDKNEREAIISNLRNEDNIPTYKFYGITASDFVSNPFVGINITKLHEQIKGLSDFDFTEAEVQEIAVKWGYKNVECLANLLSQANGLISLGFKDKKEILDISRATREQQETPGYHTYRRYYDYGPAATLTRFAAQSNELIAAGFGKFDIQHMLSDSAQRIDRLLSNASCAYSNLEALYENGYGIWSIRKLVEDGRITQVVSAMETTTQVTTQTEHPNLVGTILGALKRFIGQS